MTRIRTSFVTVPLVLALLLAACGREPPRALGTLEYDRIALPAPAAERIVGIDVREGQAVAAGDRLLRLDDTRTRAQLDALQAQALQRRGALSELEAGPREEAIAQARATLAAAQAQARDARAYFARLEPLGRQRLVAAADVDRARAAASSADAQVRALRQALLELERGTRGEQIAQGEAAVQAADAQAAAQQATLARLALVAPRAGRRWRCCWSATRRTRASTCPSRSVPTSRSAIARGCSSTAAIPRSPARCA